MNAREVEEAEEARVVAGGGSGVNDQFSVLLRLCPNTAPPSPSETLLLLLLLANAFPPIGSGLPDLLKYSGLSSPPPNPSNEKRGD